MLKRLKDLLRQPSSRQAEEPGGGPPDPALPEGESQKILYNQDGMATVHNVDFMKDPAFVRAYERGAQAARNYQIHWRVHVALWAAQGAARLPGDFVECGVNWGFMSSSIMAFLDWDRLGKMFYLLDTFNGLDMRYISEEEYLDGKWQQNEAELASGDYVTGSESARKNFAEWQNTRIIEGAIPETLAQVPSQQVAFLHIDINCAPPEVAAAEFFWDKLVAGAFVLLDDYAYIGYHMQKAAMDDFARTKNVPILSLPTGQGLIVRPPH